MPKYIDASTRVTTTSSTSGGVSSITYSSTNNATTVAGDLITTGALDSASGIFRNNCTAVNYFGNNGAFSAGLTSNFATVTNAVTSGTISSGSAVFSGGITGASAGISGAVTSGSISSGSAVFSGGITGASAGISGSVTSGSLISNSCAVSGAVSAGSLRTGSTVINGTLNLGGTSIFSGYCQMSNGLEVYNPSIFRSNLDVFGNFNVSKVYERTFLMDSTTLSCDMNNGSIFILPLSFNPTSNYAITITNCPTDTNKVFSITIVNRQATSSFYINNLKVINNNNSYIFGTANSFSSPLFNGGPVTLANSPCVISQTFNIMSVPNTSNLSGDYTKCVTSSVNSHY